MDSLQQLTAAAAEKFQTRFGRAPQWIVAAPGRVNLIGEHTDYNEGFVLPMAIERYTVLAAATNSEGSTIRVVSAAASSESEISLENITSIAEPKWINYLRGVIAGYQKLGTKIPAIDIHIESNVPLGGGLSSSAALEVATALLVESISGQKLPPHERALICLKAEQDFVGVPCGIMDQLVSCAAEPDHVMRIDCRDNSILSLPFSDPSVSILIINTGVKHELANGEYARRRDQCRAAAKFLGVASLRDADLDVLMGVAKRLDRTKFRRARHVLTENQRTIEAAEAIFHSEWKKLGDLMYASHDSLNTDYEVSCAELNTIVQISRRIGRPGGMIGCRMTGGGFGGCAVALVETEKLEKITSTISESYRKATKREAELFNSRAAGGARVIST